MIYGSVCSGIEAATVAWETLGWKAAWFSEIEPFPCAVLQHHYPDTPNLGDMTKLQERQEFNDTAIDIIIGGTPCQSFSVAGLRKGLADPRGNLALTFLSIVDRKRPRWVVWENVPGVLSSNGGRDFGAFIGGLAECGYGVAWRILDAQNFGVAQRRRRVFVIGYIGDWRPATAVLFERNSLSGNTPPSRREGKDVAACFEKCAPGSRQHADKSDNLILQPERMVSPALQARGYKGPNTDGLSIDTTSLIVMANGQGNAEICKDSSPSLTCNHEAPIAAQLSGSVRRLTPMECERLQGFPDGYTSVPFRRKLSSDSVRYKALGNSMAVPVIRWIGERIQAVIDCKIIQKGVYQYQLKEIL